VAELPPRTIGTYGVPVERDAEGFPLCRQCKKSIRHGKRPKQRTFCGDPQCLHLWKLKSDPNYQAQHVLERDKGVCALCGTDCVALLAELKALVRPWTSPYSSAFIDRCQAIGLPRHLRELRRRLWEMDHIVPVIEGGGSCGLENLRTLCWACHRKETAALAKRRAEARRAG
jgi:5-methylcytosine-specific restriction endonuclease McrA